MEIRAVAVIPQNHMYYICINAYNRMRAQRAAESSSWYLLRLDLLQVLVQLWLALDDPLDNLLHCVCSVSFKCRLDRLELLLGRGVDRGLRR